MEHELLPLSSDSWTDAQQPNPCTPTVIQGFLEHGSACMDTKVDSMMDRLEKRIDEKIYSKLGPVMDRLSVLEKTSCSTRSGPSSLSDNGGSSGQSSTAGVFTCSICSFVPGNSRDGVEFETETHMA